MFPESLDARGRGAALNIQSFYRALTCCHSPPFSLPCLLQVIPLPILLTPAPGLQLARHHHFRSSSPRKLESVFSLTAAFPTAGMTSRHLRVIRVMKSEPVAILLFFFHFVESALRLGHIGDQVFGLALTNLIQNRYPHLRVGPASVRQYSVIHPLVLSHVGNIQKVRDYVKHKPVLAEM